MLFICSMPVTSVRQGRRNMLIATDPVFMNEATTVTQLTEPELKSQVQGPGPGSLCPSILSPRVECHWAGALQALSQPGPTPSSPSSCLAVPSGCTQLWKGVYGLPTSPCRFPGRTNLSCHLSGSILIGTELSALCFLGPNLPLSATVGPLQSSHPHGPF